MTQQSARQQARRAALDAQARIRAENADQEKRRSGLAVTVVQAIAERAATVARCEQRAGQALVKLTGDEGMSLRETVQWCGEGLTTREAARLRRLAQAEPDEAAMGSRQP
ncbi:hypothetical protein [Segeticoccus rhizosphaerae]|uniref:hypothetical protein n=1 Tax=Segeticoccus rhizosphaerae TaxID=1104777 RepID=UPI0010BFC5FC|nr:hypothetical protein [Ornithinicoccus soli]